jgi:predicted RND superfamily exporter protein
MSGIFWYELFFRSPLRYFPTKITNVVLAFQLWATTEYWERVVDLRSKTQSYKNAGCFHSSYLYHDNMLFFRTGKAIGTRPLPFLFLSLSICLVSSLGLVLWKEEVDDVQLFMPVDSHVRHDASWVERNFRDEMRFESVIVEAENVLTPAVLASVSRNM